LGNLEIVQVDVFALSPAQQDGQVSLDVVGPEPNQRTLDLNRPSER
jgi:hypothetical protein